MAWIESHQELRNHPKLTLLTEPLKISKAQAVGHLHMLWWWCIDYALNGRLDTYTPAILAAAADWAGNPGVFIDAMANSGFIDRDPLRVHDWVDFCGDLIKRRLAYMANKRRRTRRLRNSPRKAENYQPTIPNHTIPNQTLPNKGDEPARQLNFVYLRPSELQKLTAQLGSRRESYIARLDGYIGQIGEAKARAKYKSHYHTILNWFRKDVDEGRTYASNDSPGRVDLKALARAAREAKGAGGDPAPGPVPDGIRDLPGIQREARRDPGGSDA